MFKKKKGAIIPLNSENQVLIVLGISLVKWYEKMFDSYCASAKQFSLVSFKDSLNRTDEKIRNLLEISFHAAIFLEKLELCKEILDYAR